MHALNTLQSNAAVLEIVKATLDAQRHLSLPQTIEMAHRAGVTVSYHAPFVTLLYRGSTLAR